MRYSELFSSFENLFPEDANVFEELKEKNSVDEEDGMHPLFGLVVVQYLKAFVLKSPVKAQRAFDFFEIMEESDDPMIAEVLEFSVLENILTDEDINYNLWINYCGEETKKAVEKIIKWLSP